MHDAAVVVGDAVVVDEVGGEDVELGVQWSGDAAEVDANELIAVRTRLLVDPAHGVSDLVNHHHLLQPWCPQGQSCEREGSHRGDLMNEV